MQKWWRREWRLIWRQRRQVRRNRLRSRLLHWNKPTNSSSNSLLLKCFCGAILAPYSKLLRLKSISLKLLMTSCAMSASFKRSDPENSTNQQYWSSHRPDQLSMFRMTSLLNKWKKWKYNQLPQSYQLRKLKKQLLLNKKRKNNLKYRWSKESTTSSYSDSTKKHAEK